jgi:hypothetical protein
MKTMNLGSDDEPVTKKKKNSRNLKIALGLAAVVLVPTIGTTLAGSINVTTPSIEFGQGVAATVTCQTSDITIIPYSSFSVVDVDFLIESIRVSGIDSTCDGKIFNIKLLNETGLPIVLGGTSPPDVCIVPLPADVATGGCVVSGIESGEFLIEPVGDVLSSAVFGISIESSNS